MNDDFKRKVMVLAHKYFEYVYEKQEYVYEDGNVYVATVDNVLVIEDNRFFHVHVVFCRNSDEARRIAEAFINMYKLQHDMRIDHFVYAFADRIITFFHHPRLFRVYQSRALPDGE
ncbi:MAG: hypothetical protein QXX12_03075 [Nanopusillaceae archaeon]